MFEERDYEFECGNLCVALLLETPPCATYPDKVLINALEHGLISAQDHLPSNLKLKQPHELSILICEEPQIQALNALWLGKNYATNTLSFPAHKSPADIMPNLGDIALCLSVLLKESAEFAISPLHHISHLTVHSFLHLLGYNHEAEQDAECMEHLETKILASIGIPDPYK